MSAQLLANRIVNKAIEIETPKPPKKESPVKKPKTKKSPVATPESEATKPAETTPKAVELATPAETPQPVSTPAPVPQPPKRLSALDQIRKARAAMNAGGLLEGIEEAKAVKADPQSVGAFLEAITAADDIAILKMSDDRREEAAARDYWYGLDLPEMEIELRKWLKAGDNVLQPVLDTLNAFKLKVSVIGPLWRLVSEVLRPARATRTYSYLAKLMDGLKNNRRVVAVPVNRLSAAEKQKAVILWGQGFLPVKTGETYDPLIEGSWHWIKEAETRAQQDIADRETAIKEMEESATCPTSAEAISCKAGTIALRIGKVGDGQGVLLEVHTIAGNTSVRVAKVIGLPRRLENNCWLGWYAGSNVWPREGQVIFHVFDAWKKKS